MGVPTDMSAKEASRAEGPAGDVTTTVTVIVRSSDLGADRYVRGEVYFTYFEQSRLEHLRRLGIVPTFPVPAEAVNYFAIAETTARFRASAIFGDALDVTTRTEHVGNRSFALAFRLVQAGTDLVVTEGRSVQVWLDAERQPAPIPQEWRARIEASIPREATDPTQG